MDFLDVDGVRYIKLDSVTDALKQLKEETEQDKNTSKFVKEIISSMMSVLNNIFTSADRSPKVNINSKNIDVVKNPNERIVGFNQ